MANESLFSGCFGCFMWLLMLCFLIVAAISTDAFSSLRGILIIGGISILLIFLAVIQFLKGSFDWIKRLFK